jgi:predicted acyltransferase
LLSLDQFRGCTVLGMFLVNFVAGYKEVPRWLHFEHTYCSYHDTIMPQFFLAVGFSLRLAFLKHLQKDGTTATCWRLVKRGFALILLGIVVYHLTGKFDSWNDLVNARQTDGPQQFVLKAFKRGPFETLTHIGLVTLFVLPVIATSAWGRAAYACVAAGLHVWLSLNFYFDWNMAAPPGIDGGPLGFLTWTIPTLVGTLAHDWVKSGTGGAIRKMIAVGVALMLIGYGLSCLNRVTPPNQLPESPTFADYLAQPPFVPPVDKAHAEAVRNYWTMSQRAGSVSYLAFATGFALVVLAGFRAVCDGWGLRWRYLDLLSRNALAGYLIHGMVADAVKPFTPRDAPAGYVWAAFAVYLGVTTLMTSVSGSESVVFAAVSPQDRLKAGLQLGRAEGAKVGVPPLGGLRSDHQWRTMSRHNCRFRQQHHNPLATGRRDLRAADVQLAEALQAGDVFDRRVGHLW